MARADFIRGLPPGLPLSQVITLCEAEGYPTPSRQAVYSARKHKTRAERPRCEKCGRKLPA